MDAIILVGGQGTRLRPLTLTRHKSLVPLCNRPAIEYLFEWLERHGIERVVLALGQANEDLAAAYPGGRLGEFELVLVQETHRLESGGAIRNAVQTAGVEGRFVVLNGDIFVDFDLNAAMAAHESREAALTLALHEVDDPSPFGVAVLDDEGMVSGFVEKPPLGTAPSNLVNAGVWIFEPWLVDEIPEGAVRVEETLFPSLVARRKRVLGYVFEGLWADIGVHSRYLTLNRELLRTHAPYGENVAIEESATVTETSIGASSRIASGAEVSGSLLWEHVSVGRGAYVRDSILADRVMVGEGARVDGVVAGSGARIPENVVVPRGTLLEPGARYDASR